jgi:hypothetical protein
MAFVTINPARGSLEALANSRNTLLKALSRQQNDTKMPGAV